MATNIYEQISANYSTEFALQLRKDFSFSEKGKRYRCFLSSPSPCAGFQVDGYIITEGKKCDKLAVVEKTTGQWATIFVELKGSDIRHAIEQLENTIPLALFQHATVSEKLARVVGHSFPSSKSDPSVEKAKIRFRQRYHCALRCLKSDQKDVV